MLGAGVSVDDTVDVGEATESVGGPPDEGDKGDKGEACEDSLSDSAVQASRPRSDETTLR